MTPSPELKARVLAAAMKEPAPDRQAVRRRAGVSWLLAGTFPLLVFGGLGGMRAVERPLPFVVATAAGWAGVALAVSWISSRRGSMVGRPLATLVFAILSTPLLLATWYLGCFLRLDGPVTVAPPSRALLCLAVSLVFAAGPFFVLAGRLRTSAPAHPRATAAAMAVVASAWAAVLMDLHCEQADPFHVTLGHVVPVLVLACAGFLLGERLLGLRGSGPGASVGGDVRRPLGGP